MNTTCAIVGGGPAGMILGFLLARAGIDVTVLEKHKDFFRDFRGDTIHPTTLQLMYDLGLLDEFLRLPHQEADRFNLRVCGELIPGPDFTTLPTHCKFMCLMPQWDFLNFIASKAKSHANFHLLMETDGTDLVREDGRVIGVRATRPQGELEIRADLVVATDGRHSRMRERAGFVPVALSVPIDVLWLRISRKESDGEQTLGDLSVGRAIIKLNRETYWQCAYIILKGQLDELKARGLPAFRDDIVSLVPALRDRVDEIASWDDVKLLTVTVDRLPQWSQPGLLCIGDAAHAMSPMGGVGINLAVADAVAAANLLWLPLRERRVTPQDLQAVQLRRASPVQKMQAFQVQAAAQVLLPLLHGRVPIVIPIMRFLLRSFPAMRKRAARLIGLGFQPEQLEAPELAPV